MTRFLVAAGCVMLLTAPAEAQRIVTTGGVALAEYREQGESIRFSGLGVGGDVAVSWRRFSLHLAASRIDYDPTDEAPGRAPFAATETDARLRFRATRLLSAEIGTLTRSVAPEHAAQEMGALRLGAVVDYPLAPGADVALRGGWIGAARFSGGGSAPLGIEVGFSASYGPGSGRVRGTADFEFQRIDRRTEVADRQLDAPIQRALGRIGVGLYF